MCVCSVCRKAKGLPPYSQSEEGKELIASVKKASHAALIKIKFPKELKPPKPKKAKADGSASKAGAASAKVKSDASKPKKKAVKAKKGDVKSPGKLKQALLKAKAAGGIKKGKGKSALKSGTPVKRKKKSPVEPKAIEAPCLAWIDSKLPAQNLAARVWLYESLVRFDAVETPVSVLKALDKFDAWTPRSTQVILERIICLLAGLGKNIDKGQARAGFAPIVKAFREVGDQAATRGEPWEEAKQLLLLHDVEIPQLPHVEHVFSLEEIEEVAPPSPTIFTRMTRARRAAYDNHPVHRISMREASVSDFEDYTSDREYNEEEDSVEESSKRRKSSERKSAEEDDPNLRRSGRKHGRLAEESDEDDESEQQQQQLEEGDDASSALSENMDASQNPTQTTVESEVKAPEPAGQVPAPNLEEKVGVLSALMELVIRTPEVSKDLRQSAERMYAIEKDSRMEVFTLEKEQTAVMKELDSSAPSMLKKDEFQQWTKKVRTAATFV